VFTSAGLGVAFDTANDTAYDTVLATLARRDRLDAAIAAMAAASVFTSVVGRLGCLRGADFAMVLSGPQRPPAVQPFSAHVRRDLGCRPGYTPTGHAKFDRGTHERGTGRE
jgi:hypothetical protein